MGLHRVRGVGNALAVEPREHLRAHPAQALIMPKPPAWIVQQKPFGVLTRVLLRRQQGGDGSTLRARVGPMRNSPAWASAPSDLAQVS